MSDKGKTILILGNGFDLAHGLPTKYSNFLDFCWRVECIWTYGDVNDQTTIENFKNKYIDGWKIDSTIKEGILEEFAERRSVAVDGLGRGEVLVAVGIQSVSGDVVE